VRSGPWAAALALALVACVTACDPFDDAAAPSAGSSVPATSPTTAPTTSPAPAGSNDEYAPPRFAPQVRKHAKAAAVSPVLLMAILYNESYKPHDPDLERAWQKIDPDAAFGVANMHEAAFDDTKRGRPFADRQWTELPDDPDLAIEAAAWYLHDLAAGLTGTGGHDRNDLLATGYNAGPGHMAAVAAGTAPNAGARDYVANLHENWSRARRALR
jgi:soluble lytic murein transglycosylase-like protein